MAYTEVIAELINTGISNIFTIIMLYTKTWKK